MALRLLLLPVCVLVGGHDAHAWNPLSALGSLVGKPVGGFVEAATRPTILTAEASGYRLIEDLDTKIGGQIQNLGDAVGESLDKAEVIAGRTLDRADAMMAARVAQIDTSADRIVTKAIGSIDEAAGRNIDKFFDRGTRLVRVLGGEARTTLDKADQVIASRTEQIETAVRRSIEASDAVLEKRIQQVDEIMGRRVGNVDVILTKQTLSLEGSLLKVVALIALLAFVVFVLRELYKDIDQYYEATEDEDRTRFSRARWAAWAVAKGICKRSLVAAVGAAVLYGSYRFFPSESDKQLQVLIATHADALDASEQRLDFTGVRYHASQLALLDVKHEGRYRAQVLKSGLIRDVLSRPGLLLQPQGVQQVKSRLDELEWTRQAAKLPVDPDVYIVECFLSWQLAGTRSDEYRAVSRCAQALELGHASSMRGLAYHYVRSFLHNPPPGEMPRGDGAPGYSFESLRGLLAASSSEQVGFPPLQHAAEYNALVRELDVRSTDAYLQMLRSHAELKVAAQRLGKTRVPRRDTEPNGLSEWQRRARQAKIDRRAHAKEVIAAWAEFDEAIASSPRLAGTSSSLAVFMLNDAVLAHALWFFCTPETTGLPPAISRISDVKLRLAVAPIRIAWARRYINPLGKRTQQIVSFQEGERFKKLESELIDFEKWFVEYEQLLRHNPSAELHVARLKAAEAAAQLGLYSGKKEHRQALGVLLLGKNPAEKVLAKVADAYEARTLRFL